MGTRTTREFTLLFLQFYQSVSISSILNYVYTWIWVKSLAIKQIPGCGKDRDLAKICWKLSIFVSKALISWIWNWGIVIYMCFLKIKLDWDLYLYNFVFANFFCIFLSMKLFLKKWETCAWFCFFFTVFLSMHEHQSLNIVFKGNKTKTLVNLMM